MPRISPEAAFPWKLRLFFAGALFFLLGIFLDRRPLIVAAIVTLAIGIIASMFTAIFVTRTLFLAYLQRRPAAQSLSI